MFNIAIIFTKCLYNKSCLKPSLIRIYSQIKWTQESWDLGNSYLFHLVVSVENLICVIISVNWQHSTFFGPSIGKYHQNYAMNVFGINSRVDYLGVPIKYKFTGLPYVPQKMSCQWNLTTQIMNE